MPIPKWGHKGDTFREILSLWEQKGFVNLCASPDRYVWWEKPGYVLLHDHPQLFDVNKQLPDFKLGLFANEYYESEKSKRWIFWPRNPRKTIEKFENMKHVPVHKRYWKSTFIGKVENQIQLDNRFQSRIDWTKYIQLIKIVKGVQTPYPYPPEVYLHVLSKSKMGLLLPGYGPKCNRDIECCAMGCVPIKTPGVCTEYYNKWNKNENYLVIEDESDIISVLNTDNYILQYIQENNIKWFKENCTIEGSFETTRKIIEG